MFSRTVNSPWSFLSGPMIVEGMGTMNHINVIGLWTGSWTCRSQWCDMNLIKHDCVCDISLFFFMVGPSHSFHDYCSVLFMSIKAGLYIIPTAEWMMQASSPIWLLTSFFLSVFYFMSPQGEASQHSPAGGRLRDQKRVLSFPWTVS